MKRFLIALTAVLGVCAAAGCQGRETATSPIPVGSPSHEASPGPSAPPPDGFAEGTQPSSGPLVFLQVIDWLGEADVAESGATFHLTEHCAYLQGPPDQRVLLVWPRGQAWVDPASPATVQFREPASGKLVRLTDGQRVNLGGYRVGGQGYTYEPPPHPSCPSDEHDFAVQEVR